MKERFLSLNKKQKLKQKSDTSMDIEFLVINTSLMVGKKQEGIYIMTDSKSTIDTNTEERFSKLLTATHERDFIGKSQEKRKVQWINIHCGVLGNEWADEIVKWLFTWVLCNSHNTHWGHEKTAAWLLWEGWTKRCRTWDTFSKKWHWRRCCIVHIELLASKAGCLLFKK